MYLKPWCRIAPYLLGILLGYALLHRARFLTEVMPRPAVAVLGWLTTTVLMLGLLLVHHRITVEEVQVPEMLRQHTDTGLTPLEPAVQWLYDVGYVTLRRIVWSLGVSWIILACITGSGGVYARLVKAVLGWRPWSTLGNLTFGAYLIHPAIIFYVFGNVDTLPTFSVNTAIIYSLGITALSYAAALILAVTVESCGGAAETCAVRLIEWRLGAAATLIAGGRAPAAAPDLLVAAVSRPMSDGPATMRGTEAYYQDGRWYRCGDSARSDRSELTDKENNNTTFLHGNGPPVLTLLKKPD